MKTDAHFLSALSESSKYVSVVASWLQSKNCDVVIKPVSIRPSFESRNEFADSGDIEIRQRIEVKRRSVEFTCEDDYPYSTVIVDEKFKIDRIPRGRLWGYVIVNKQLSHVCCVMPDTKKEWMVERMFDKSDGQERLFYVCPKHLCIFSQMN